MNYQEEENKNFEQEQDQLIDTVKGDTELMIKNLVSSENNDTESQVNQLTSRTSKDDEPIPGRQSYENDHNSLTLSHSGDSYQQSNDKEFGRSLRSVITKNKDSSHKSKKISQESA